jgi:hypothetical protein
MNCPIALLVRIEASIKEAARMHLTDVAEHLLEAKHALLARVRERVVRKVKVGEATDPARGRTSDAQSLPCPRGPRGAG